MFPNSKQMQMNQATKEFLNQRSNELYLHPTPQFKDKTPSMNAPRPQIPLRNSIPFSLYNPLSAGYMPNTGINPVNPYSSVYNSYMPYNHQQNDWRNMLTEYGVPQHFQYVEHIIRTFGSISTMLESTFNAIQSSFYSIVAVGDQLKQMKSQFGQILSTLSLIRLIKWTINKLRLLLRLRDPTTMNELWKTTVSEVGGSVRNVSISSIPISAYILIYAAPFLLMKAFKLIMQNANENKWHDAKSRAVNAIALFSYEAVRSDELSIKAKDILKVAPKGVQNYSDWCLVSNGTHRGLVPLNCIRIDGQYSMGCGGLQ